MKKIVIIAAIIMLLIGGVFAGAGYALGGETVMTYTDDGLIFGVKQDKYVTETISDDIKNIDADVSICELLSVKKGETFSVKYNEKYVEFTIEGNTAEIKQVNDVRFRMFGIGSWNAENHTVEITIPANVRLDEISLNNSVGVIEMDEVVAESVGINADLGDIELNDVTADLISTTMSTGMVSMNGIETSLLSIGSSIGDVNIDDATIGSFSATLSTGSMRAEDVEITQKGELEISLGDLFLQLQGEREDYKVEAIIELGTLNIEDDTLPTPTVVGDGGVPIEVSVNTGSVAVEYTE